MAHGIAFIYRGRYIKRFQGSKGPCYLVAWQGGGSERSIWYGTLPDLLEHLDDTIRFFGRWEALL